MKEFIDYLERKIEGCDSLGGMEREKAVYQSVLKDYRKQFAISGVGSSMVKLCGNTTNKEYAGFTDQIIAINKNGQTIVLEPEDLKKLEQVVGGKFRR